MNIASFHTKESAKAAKVYYGNYLQSAKANMAAALKAYGFTSKL
jgi:hypothetical protein